MTDERVGRSALNTHPRRNPALNAGVLKSAIAAVKPMLSARETGVGENCISIIRQLVQKGVVAPSADGK